MKPGTIPRVRPALLALLLGLVAGNATAGETTQAVTIELREKAVVARRCVRIGDIADLDGGTAGLRQRIADIDVDELPGENQPRVISRAQVQFRLRLAGLSGDQFRLEGPSESLAVPDRKPISPELVVEAAKEGVYKRLAYPREDLSIRLVQPVVAVLPSVAADETPEFQVESNRRDVTLGRVQMNVTIRIEGEKKLALPVFLEVLALQEIACCRRRIERGQTLTEADVTRERRVVNSGDRQPVAVAAVIGAAAKHQLMPGQIITAYDVYLAADSNLGGPIQAGSTVRMMAHVGSAEIVAMGQALENGSTGQMIRVRNVDSKKILTGRVVGPRCVEIDLGK